MEFVHMKLLESRIIPLLLQTIPLGNNHKERKEYESNRNRSSGGRFGQNRHTERNSPYAANPGGRPLVENIDRVGWVLMAAGSVDKAVWMFIVPGWNFN